MSEIKLNDTQWKALATLAIDPGNSWIPPATKSRLRKLGLVGRVKGRDDGGRQKTTSPLTDAGRALLAERDAHLEEEKRAGKGGGA